MTKITHTSRTCISDVARSPPLFNAGARTRLLLAAMRFDDGALGNVSELAERPVLPSFVVQIQTIEWEWEDEDEEDEVRPQPI